MKTKLCFIFIISTCLSILQYKKVVIDDPSAKCLDGSQSAYYIWEGYSDKLLLFIEGGGWCGDNDFSSTLQNCYQRSKTNLGSSTKYPDIQKFSQGILSDDKDNYFNGWTRVFLKYCDGTGHQGTRSEPILYKGAQLFFRGQNVTLAQFASVNSKTGMFSGKIKQLVLTGESAGGLATFHWTNYVLDNIKKQTKFWSIPDSGVFIDFPNSISKKNQYRIWFQNLLKFSNEEVATPVRECNQAYPSQLWKCMFAQYLHPFIRAPLFAPQSLYDSWSLYNIVGLRCVQGSSLASCSPADRATAQDYKTATLNVMFALANKNSNAVWSPVCINHCYLSNEYYASQNYRIPMHSQFSLITSVKDWIQGADISSRHIDVGTWPNNTPCAQVRFFKNYNYNKAFSQSE